MSDLSKGVLFFSRCCRGTSTPGMQRFSTYSHRTLKLWGKAIRRKNNNLMEYLILAHATNELTGASRERTSSENRRVMADSLNPLNFTSIDFYKLFWNYILVIKIGYGLSKSIKMRKSFWINQSILAAQCNLSSRISKEWRQKCWNGWFWMLNVSWYPQKKMFRWYGHIISKKLICGRFEYHKWEYWLRFVINFRTTKNFAVTFQKAFKRQWQRKWATVLPELCSEKYVCSS